MNQLSNVQIVDDLIAMNKMRPQVESFFELCTYDLIPVNVIKIRRDKTSVGGKIRKKYINLSSDLKPVKISINNIKADFKITRGFGIIKVDVTEILSKCDSGFKELGVKFEYIGGSTYRNILVDFRSRNHHVVKNQLLFEYD